MHDYELKLVDSSRLLADILVNDIGNNPERFEEMMNLSLRDEYPLSMRAARVIALVIESYPDLVYPYIPIMISRLSQLKTEGVRRGFLKVLSEQPFPYDEEQMGILTDIAFTWLSDPKEAVSIRYYSIEILLNVSKKYPEIQNELKSILNELLEDGSSGLQAKSTMVLKYLKRL